MGAVHYSLDPRLASLLKDTLDLDVFVETGTGGGDTVAVMRPLFSEIHTIERDESLHATAARRFHGDPAVRLRCGDSAVELPRIVPGLESRGVFYWLDAHATGEAPTDGPECPLIEELRAISRLNEKSVIAIDDARFLLSPPPSPRRPESWPTLADVLGGLGRLSTTHEPMVLDDVLVFVPPSARGPLRDFAHHHGFDWLQAADKSRGYDTLLSEARAKDALIRRLDLECRQSHERLAALQEKQTALDQALRELEDLRRARDEYAEWRRREEEARRREEEACQREEDARQREEEARRREKWHLGRQRWRVRFSPKLGLLEHHPPRVIEVPDRYRRTPAPVPAPVISVVTPSFHQGAFLERTLRSVLDQAYPRLEYIVQDGGSVDDTPAVLERYRHRLARVVSAPDRGQADAINRGFAASTGEILGYLNSDDTLLPGALATVASAFAAHPDVDVIYGHRVLIDEGDHEIGRWVLPPHDGDVLSWADYVPQETLFWRRRIWERVGAHMDESFRFALDWDLLLRFRDAGARFLCLPRFLGCFRVHALQKTSAEMNGRGLAEMARLRERCHGRAVTQAEVLRRVGPYLLRHLVLHKLYRLGLLRY